MAAQTQLKEAIQSVLARHPNIPKLKSEQEECLEHFISGKDVVVLLPTGFGKSLIFQLALLVAKELARMDVSEANPIVVVISPLLALMEDQIKEAEKLGVTAGQLGVHDDRDILEGRFSLVFGSPESWLLNSKWRRMLTSSVYQQNIIGIVVDEVHVTYKWGEAPKGESPFRESFAKLGELRSITKEETESLDYFIWTMQLTSSPAQTRPTSVLDSARLDHAKEILLIIADVFGDVDQQSDLVGDFTEPDLYYSDYFDNDDDDDDDALMSHVSSSESEQ
ncbi:hypothetical protein QQF64_033794 [Cirrhinus molitorella]|uniref:DNA 3'-5' helicase n=1 Tax=Cirrhinus molitorella TaxID=172907 RepID=A0ABR3MUZ7_9TELE